MQSLFSATMYILVPLLGLAALIRWYRGRAGDEIQTPPSRFVRVTESFCVFLLATLLLSISATDFSRNTGLFDLERIPMRYVVTHGMGLALAALVMLYGVSRAFAGRMGLAFATIFSVYLIHHVSTAHLSDAAWEHRLEPPPAPRMVVFKTEQDIAEGVDLWFNDVHLGKTPITISMDELEARAPLRNHPERRIPGSAPTGPGGRLQFQKWRGSEPDRIVTHEDLRIVYSGETSPWDGMFSGGGGRSWYEYHLDAFFPARLARMEALLNQARLKNCRIDETWHEAFATFGMDGVEEVRRLGIQSNAPRKHGNRSRYRHLYKAEPAFLSIPRKRARLLYGLDTVTDTPSAHRIYEAIMKESDAQGEFRTDGIAAIALQEIAPLLDADALAKRAVMLHRKYDDASYFWHDPAQVLFMADGRNWMNSGSQPLRRSERLPASTAVEVYAARQIDAHLDATGAEHNPIERLVAPELLRRGLKMYGSLNLLRAAVDLGGDEVRMHLSYRYTHQVTPVDHRDDYVPTGNHFWLYWLLHLDVSDEVLRRRQPDIDSMMKSFLERFEVKVSMVSDFEDFTFVFCDVDRGEDSLAYRWWPAFRDAVLESGSEGFRSPLLRDYLSRMGDTATPELYAGVWRVLPRPDRYFLHELYGLPRSNRERIKDAIFSAYPNLDEKKTREVKAQLFYVDIVGDEILSHLQENPSGGAKVARWLELHAPTHPVITRMAKADAPKIRILVLDAIQTCPTLDNQAALTALLADPDDGVREKAEAVNRALQELVNTPPATYVSNATVFNETALARYQEFRAHRSWR